MKTIAFYLPQFHRIPENDKWWGEGFTVWVNVKNAQPLFDGHEQPKMPFNKNYYDLTDVEVMKWQATLAKKYGIFGFCMYHYWFDGHLLLEKPVENYLKSDIDFPFCLCWPNEHWTNAWVSGENKVLIEQRYGSEKEWRDHYNYLVPFFKDSRYIRKSGKILFVIYRPELISERKEMFECWNRWAVEDGIGEISFMFQRPDVLINKPNEDMSMFDNVIEYQPYTAFLTKSRKNFSVLKKIKNNVGSFLEKHFKISAGDLRVARKTPVVYDYDELWSHILSEKPLTDNSIPCAFVNWDNTPRRGANGSVIQGMTVEKFEFYLKKLIQKTRDEYKSDFLFMFAWNEWAEGGYLEPDDRNGTGYLQAIYNALKDTGEL